jgi:hypothetical protein
VVIVFGDGESRQFNGPVQSLGIDEVVVCETFSHYDLRAVDVIGSKGCVGRAAKQRHRVPLHIPHELTLVIAATDTPHIPDVMKERSEDAV